MNHRGVKMRTIEVDEEVFAYLQKNAIPYIETPNLTIRRLFELPVANSLNGIQGKHRIKDGSKRKKRQKTNLQTLIGYGLLQEGQTLFLHDYQGLIIRGYEAVISGKSLVMDSKKSSMSDHAKNCLKKEGYKSDSVRGPSHWYNSDGVSVKDLWSHFLNKGMAN